MKQIKITKTNLQKLKNLKNLFHLSMDEMNQLALNYAYEYSIRLKKPINTYNLEEESHTKLLSLNISNDLENQLEELDSNYDDILQTGIELLYEQNMIYPKKDYSWMKTTLIIFFSNFFFFLFLFSLFYFSTI